MPPPDTLQVPMNGWSKSRVLGGYPEDHPTIQWITRPDKPTKLAIENGPVEIVSFPSKNGDFP